MQPGGAKVEGEGGGEAAVVRDAAPLDGKKGNEKADRKAKAKQAKREARERDIHAAEERRRAKKEEEEKERLELEAAWHAENQSKLDQEEEEERKLIQLAERESLEQSKKDEAEKEQKEQKERQQRAQQRAATAKQQQQQQRRQVALGGKHMPSGGYTQPSAISPGHADAAAAALNGVAKTMQVNG